LNVARDENEFWRELELYQDLYTENIADTMCGDILGLTIIPVNQKLGENIIEKITKNQKPTKTSILHFNILFNLNDYTYRLNRSI